MRVQAVASVLLTPSVILLLSYCTSVKACGGGGSTSTPTNDTNQSWVRCLKASVTTGATCRVKQCDLGETQSVSPSGGYSSSDQCKLSTLYQQCYDYSKDGSTFGTCQPDYAGCTSTNKKILASAFDDKACGLGKSLELATIVYARCVTSAAVVTCRPVAPLKIGCATSETMNPADIVYLSSTECLQ